MLARFVGEVLAFIGLAPGYAWCMAFAVWVVFTITRLSTLKITGGVQDQVDHAKALGVCLSADDVRSGKAVLQPGDLMCEYGLSGGYWHYDHTGVVTAVARDGSFVSCEGNTNEGDCREGYEVAEHHRNIADVVQTDKGPHNKYCFISTV